jgi:hypothetical protein
MQLSVVRNLILVEFSDWFAASGLLVIDAVGWRSMYLIVMPRVNLIVILATYARYLYSINFPTIICLPSMRYLFYEETPLVNCGPRSNILYIAITCLLLIVLFTLLAYYYCFPLDTLIPLFTANQWDWQPHRKLGAKYLVVLCAGSILLLAKQSLDEVPYKLSGAVAKLAGITFRRLAFSYWTINLGFLLRENGCYTHHTFLLGFPTGRWFTLTPPQQARSHMITIRGSRQAHLAPGRRFRHNLSRSTGTGQI